MLYVILNDGETFTEIMGCAIYDSTTKSIFGIKVRRKINKDRVNDRWDKGIESIERMEQEDRQDIIDIENDRYDGVIDLEDDGILGK